MLFFSWLFLAEFNQLEKITIHHSLNVQIFNLPPLTSLIDLHIRRSTGLKSWTHFPLLANGLTRLVIEYCELNDEEMGRILNWIQSGPSNDTLLYIDLSGNALTRIPRQLHVFPHLIDIILEHQKEPGFSTISDLSFVVPIRILNLQSSHISDIEPDAFKGLNFLKSMNEFPFR